VKNLRFKVFLFVFSLFFALQNINIFANEMKIIGYPVITGVAGAIMDYDSGAILWSKNADSKKTIASMTKVLAVAVILDEIKAGNLSMNDRVAISEYASSISHDPAWAAYECFKVGEVYTVRALLTNAVVSSSNASIIAIGEHISGSTANFAIKMNTLATKIGMEGNFTEPSGIDEANVTTAKSMLKLGKYMYDNHEKEIKKMTMLKEVYIKGISKEATNKLLLNDYYGIEGLKTGAYSTENANFIGVAKRGKKRLIAVTMHTNSDNRFTDTIKMFEFGWKNDFNKYWKNDKRLAETQISSDNKKPKNGDKFKVTLSNMQLKNRHDFTGKVKWFVNGKPYHESEKRDMTYSNISQIEVSKTSDAPLKVTAQLWFENEMYNSYSIIFQDTVRETQAKGISRYERFM
jgi:beta-lactamase